MLSYRGPQQKITQSENYSGVIGAREGITSDAFCLIFFVLIMHDVTISERYTNGRAIKRQLSTTDLFTQCFVS